MPKVINYDKINNIITVSEDFYRKDLSKYYHCTVGGGGIFIKRTTNGNQPIINQNIKFGTLGAITQVNNSILFSCDFVYGKRTYWKSYTNTGESASSFINPNKDMTIIIDDCCGWYLWAYGSSRNSCQNIKAKNCFMMTFGDTYSAGTYFGITNCSISNYGYIIGAWGPMIGKIKLNSVYFPGLYGDTLGHNNFYYHLTNCKNSNDNIIDETIFEKNGKIEKSSTSWHHKPNSASATTWKYADHFVPPRKSLHLKISRMVEATSSSSEARVAITDTVNWYPETKFGALAEQVISGIEPDKWQTYSLKWRNDSDEPHQVRVWECASGSTDAGYLSVETASGGPL